jgi:hypothetical protein
MEYNETLKAAIEKEKGKDFVQQIELLTDDAAKLTEDQIAEFANGTNLMLSVETIDSLAKLAKLRIINGQGVFPWGDFNKKLKPPKRDHMRGGFW